MSGYIIAIDLGGTNLKIGLVDRNYRIIRKLVLPTDSYRLPRGLISAITAAAGGLIKKSGLDWRDILGIGIGVPGPVDVKTGVVDLLPNIAGWKKVPLGKILSRKFKVPVFIDNDANLMALAEAKFGRAKGLDNAVCLTLGTGVGGGIVIGGKLYRGSTFNAGEIGHMPLNEKGRVCSCGGYACLERYVGNKEILRRAEKVLRRKTSLEDLSRLASSGDARAKQVWEEVAGRLGSVIAGVVNLLNPDCVVIGGGVSAAGKVLFANLRKAVRRRAMPTQARHVKIYRAKLTRDAGIIGAAVLVKEDRGKNEDLHR